MISRSLLKTISLGIVAKDIEEDEVYVDIYPLELQPNVDGEVTIPVMHNTTVTDTLDNIDNINIVKTTLFKAKWLPDGDTNRLEPPTVCKGEVVRLLRYSDDDKYYWSTLYNQLELRKLEKRTIVVSNKRSIEIDPEELLEHSYFSQMDTINKSVHIHTSTTDGEYTTYDIHIDTKEGILTILDGKDNSIVLESQDDKLTISTNKDIVTNTTNNTENYRNHNQINLKTYAVDNGADELIQTLTDFVQATHDAIGIGNLGAPVPMDGGTKAAFDAIKARLEGFMR